MKIWLIWWDIMQSLRPAFKRKQTFFWFVLACAGFTMRGDLAGVTSIVRSLGLKPSCYDRLLDLFHSAAAPIKPVTKIWVTIVLKLFRPFLCTLNGRLILMADGIKIAKAGRKMPAVKKLHQTSGSNTKPAYIFGHSCQAIAILAGCMESFFAIPLSCRIHEGLVLSNRGKKTLIDKLAILVDEMGFNTPIYLVADAYYSARNLILPLLKSGHHLIASVRMNAVAYVPAKRPEKPGRGAPKKYGKKIGLRALFKSQSTMQEAKSPIYGERKVTLKFHSVDLIWRQPGILVRFIIIRHPLRGKKILMSTDLSLTPIQIIQTYGYRFKIEVAFKQAIHTIGTYSYHFWMSTMKRIKRKAGNQYLHREPKIYRDAVMRKIGAYHLHMMAGIIVQGMLQYLSIAHSKLVWNSFGSWIRTIRPNILPSEKVVAVAMKNVFPEFLGGKEKNNTLMEFIRKRVDLNRTEGLRMIA